MDLNSSAIAHITAREGVVPRWFVWIVAKDRATGDPETFGVWSGDEAVTVTIEGQSRTYQAGGALLDPGQIVYETGPTVRRHKVSLSPLDAGVENAIRGYDVRLAPVQIHLGLFDPETMALIDTPRAWDGKVDKAPIITPEVGGKTSVTLEVASSSRRMTRTLALKRSDESYKLRSGDRIGRYSSVSGAVDVWWGQAKESSS